MDESILNTIKKMLGMAAEYNAFDTDIIVFINSALMILHQYGATPKGGFAITGPTEIWSDCLPSDKMLEAAKEYIYLKVKIVFDPPQSSFVLAAYEKKIDELEWRLKEQLEEYDAVIGEDQDIEEPDDDEEDDYIGGEP